MPSLKDTLVKGVPEGYEPVDSSPAAQQTNDSTFPTASRNIRTVLPPIGADTDSLRQFEGKNTSPQFRIIPLAPQTGGGTTVSAAGGGTSTSGGSGGTVPASIASKTASLFVAQIPAGSAVRLTAILSQSFQVLYLASNQAACIRLYGAQVAQVTDSVRAVDAPAPAETTQGLILDVVLDTAPFIWYAQNVVGSNQNTTQSALAYVTVINPSNAPLSNVVITLAFVPLET